MGSPTVTAPASPTLQPTSSQELRSNFLTVIGIDSTKVASEHETAPLKRQLVAREWIHSRQQQANTCRSEGTLKFDPSDDRYFPKRKRIETKSDEERPRKRISFDTKVKVFPIPMRDEYCIRVRSRLWSNALEIHENATRNSIEFAAEGWDWRTVMEDESMFVDVETGELIHPIHYETRQANS